MVLNYLNLKVDGQRKHIESKVIVGELWRNLKNVHEDYELSKQLIY